MVGSLSITDLGAEPAMTRFDAASRTLRAVARACGLDRVEEERAVAVFRTLADSWADAPLSALPPWSGLGADASGCDMSMVLDGERREVRVTAEAQGHPPSPHAYWEAAMRLSEVLEARYGADLSRLRALSDIFRPLDPDAAGVLWHGAVFQAGKAPWFKVYLHLMALGQQSAHRTAYAALERLGIEDGWDAVESRLHGADELLFLSFDLVSADVGRVKIYIRHAEATTATLVCAAQLPGSDNSADIRAFVEELAGGDNPIIRRGALTSLQLKRGSNVPVHATTHIRLYPHCASSDAVLFARIRRALQRLGIPTAPYEKAVAALAARGLGEEGVHGWASVQWTQQRPSVTVYLSPRLYFARHGPIALDPSRMWPSPVVPQRVDERHPACASP
jgi:Tryptophan dimethylallyltransferase